MISKLGFGSLIKKTSRDIYGEFLESKHYGFYTAGSTLMILGGIYYLPGSQCHYRIVEFANDTSLVLSSLFMTAINMDQSRLLPCLS